jgi:mannose-6-phosphate isomerase-like protein (cupin superfamily)
MEEVKKKNFASPDDVTRFPKVKIESVRVGNLDVKRLTAEPGWRWSEHVGPAMGASSCRLEHIVWLVIEGRFGVRMDDGEAVEFGPGDVGSIGRGHDAWVVGDEPVIGIDVQMAPMR